jgi:hypothetical protein
MFGIRRTLDRLTLVLPLFVLAACADDAPVTSPVSVTDTESAEPASNRGVVASVNCAADIAKGTLLCGEVPVVDPETGLQRVTLGGQLLYVWLRSFSPSYNATTEIFQADVQVANLIPQGLGSSDGLTTTGIKVFHHTGPVVTSGTGTVTVENPDGFDMFTGSNQPYFEYLSYLPAFDPPTAFGTSLKTWRWNVPPTVTTFEFTVFVDADVVGENGYVQMTPGSALLATVGATTTVVGEAKDVVGRALSSTVTYTSSDPTIASVDLNTGLVQAVSPGVVDIIGSTVGPEVDGRTRVTVAPATSGFDIRFEFVTPATPTEQAAFTSAATKWEGLVTGDLPTELVQLPFIFCGGVADEYVDDLTIRVAITPIDGPGGILGQAGPCWLRSGSNLPALGVMQFDSDDTGRPDFGDVVLHEMGHVLGVGSLWETFNLLSDDNGPLDDCFPVPGDPPPPLTTDPYFSGTAAIATFTSVAFGGDMYAGNAVPAENDHGAGTRCVHWRETVLDNELMTGFAESSGTMPLSELTVKSLADMGYAVAASGWDPFTCPACAPPAPGAPPAAPEAGDYQLLNDVLFLPLYSRDAQGRVIEVRPGEVRPGR